MNGWFVGMGTKLYLIDILCFLCSIDKAKLASLVGTLQREDLLPKERSQATLQLLQLYLSMQLNNNDYTSNPVSCASLCCSLFDVRVVYIMLNRDAYCLAHLHNTNQSRVKFGALIQSVASRRQTSCAIRRVESLNVVSVIDLQRLFVRSTCRFVANVLTNRCEIRLLCFANLEFAFEIVSLSSSFERPVPVLRYISTVWYLLRCCFS